MYIFFQRPVSLQWSFCNLLECILLNESNSKFLFGHLDTFIVISPIYQRNIIIISPIPQGSDLEVGIAHEILNEIIWENFVGNIVIKYPGNYVGNLYFSVFNVPPYLFLKWKRDILQEII